MNFQLVVTRSEIDMEDIKVEFQRKYSKTLKSFIQGDTSGGKITKKKLKFIQKLMKYIFFNRRLQKSFICIVR